MDNLLKGFGIAITRPIAQATKLSALIFENEGTPISFPLIDIVPLQDYSVFDRTIQTLETCDWA
ncbi:MAG TPA: uroporphyrinogen-III synthase, partial [Methylotenera sp.]|nr:uroporphyrinogen-III synthase [Methylotenera sp.]